ncbi:MAG: DUF4091 domain-containing protein [Planctomycetes bacterium]|nr:DUF4091 domain-containing protein [Planctomycetota bacterium]
MKPIREIGAAALLGCAVLAAGCARTAEPEFAEVYALGDSYKLNREGTRIFSNAALDLAALKKKSLIWDAESKTISLCGAQDETVAFQLVLQAGAAGAKDVDLAAGDLAGAGTIPAASLEFFKEWYIQTKRGSAPQCQPSAGIGWYPDALVPWDVADAGAYDGPPFAIEASLSQAAWVDLHIPANAAPGEYRGKIELRLAGKPAEALALKLRVYPFALPKQRHNLLLMNGNPPDILGAGGSWLGKDEAKKEKFEEACFKLGRRHGFTWGNMYYQGGFMHPASLTPKLTLDADGNIAAVDWTEYDKHWSKLLDPKDNLFGPGEPPIEYWRLPMATGLKKRPRFPESEKAWAQFPEFIRKHWAEKGWDLDRAYVYLADEPVLGSLGELEKLAKVLHSASNPPLHAQVAVLPQPAKKLKEYKAEFMRRFPGLIDRCIWSANSCDPAELASTFPAGAWKGFYQGNEPYAGVAVLDKDGLDLRTWAWIAWQYKLDFSCYYSITEYSGDEEETKMDFKPNAIWTQPENRPNGNQSKGVLVYPGGFVKDDRPIASIRLKEVRRGQQDYEYLWLLAQKGKREEADAGVRKILVKALAEAAEPEHPGTAGPWNRDPEAWEAQVRSWGETLAASGK